MIADHCVDILNANLSKSFEEKQDHFYNQLERIFSPKELSELQTIRMPFSSAFTRCFFENDEESVKKVAKNFKNIKYKIFEDIMSVICPKLAEYGYVCACKKKDLLSTSYVKEQAILIL